MRKLERDLLVYHPLQHDGGTTLLILFFLNKLHILQGLQNLL